MKGAGPALLRFETVSRSFGERRILRGLSADIPTAGITFIVGRSGAGKSVLCRLAVGLLRPDSGKVELFGTRVDSMPERRLLRLREQAPYLVQGPALLDWLTLEENVALAAPHRSRAEIQELMDHVGLAEFAQRLPASLGTGLQKRAAIARALALNPRYLLLDEPTTGLDRRAARQVLDALRVLKLDGLGALVVSHDYRALAEVADHVVMVSGGQVGFQGSASEFLRSSNPEVRALRDADAAEVMADG